MSRRTPRRGVVRGISRLVCIVSLLLSSLVACAHEGTPENGSLSTLVPSVPPPTSTPLPVAATTSARILARGALRVGIRYDLPPFGYITDEGEATGFGVDMGRELARRWLGDPQKVEFRQVRSDTALEHLRSGDVDLVIAPLIHTQEREAMADFSLPYFIDGHALLVRAADAQANGGPIASPLDLQGRRVGVLAWEDADDALASVLPFTVTFQFYDRFDTAVGALSRGEIDAVAELRQRLFWGQRLSPDTAIVGQYTAAAVGLAFAQHDAFFADLVNLTFQEMVVDGTYGTLYARWFPTEYPPDVERWPGRELPTLADAPVEAGVPNALLAIQTRGRVVAAMPPDRAPYAYVDAAGNPVGYEVNLAQRMAGYWLGDSTAVEFVTTTLEMGKEMVRTGQADLLLGGLPHTRAAEMELDFSLTTYWGGEGLMVLAGVPITDLRQLDGQAVAVRSGEMDTLQMAAQEWGVRLTVMPQPTVEAALALLQAGGVVAVFGERADLLGPAYATPGVGVLPFRLRYTPLAIGLPPGDSAFRDLVNLTLLAMKAAGEFDAIYYLWFDDPPPALESWPGTPYRPLRLENAAPPGG